VRYDVGFVVEYLKNVEPPVPLLAAYFFKKASKNDESEVLSKPYEEKKLLNKSLASL
jgi:hypothetical protein